MKRRDTGMLPNMRIAVDANPAARTLRTGTERYTVEILTALGAQDSDHQYVLFADQPVPPADLLLPANFEWRYLPRVRAWSHRALGPAASRVGASLLFVPAHVLPVTYRGRSVVTVHDVGHRSLPGAYRRSAWWYLEVTTRWAVRFADRLIAPSRSTRDDLMRLYGVPAARIACIPEGVATDARPAEAPAVAEAQQRYGLSPPYFLFVGTLHPRKNLDFLARAFDHAFAPGPTAFLALAGHPGDDADRLDRHAGVRRLGYVPRADLLALLTGARALVLPSHHEGFGLTALEALACGTPVVAASAGALSEVVGAGGILLAPDDLAGWSAALRKLHADDSLRPQLAAFGAAELQRFSWSRAAAALLAVFGEVAHRPAASR